MALRRALAMLPLTALVGLLAHGCGVADTSATRPAQDGAAHSRHTVELRVTTAHGTSYQPGALVVTAADRVVVHYRNELPDEHNIRFVDGTEPSDATLAATERAAGPGVVRAVTFVAPVQAGTYLFFCDVHPDEMRGALLVADGEFDDVWKVTAPP